MIITAKILEYKDGKLILEPSDDIARELMQKHVDTVELILDDGRLISAVQRRKIFAIIHDVQQWSGHDHEYLRECFTWNFILSEGGEWFSLSRKKENCVDMTTAKEFITYLIGFCFFHNIPTKDTLLNQTDDIGKYLYQCLEHRKCAICNDYAEVHHVDRIGMGRNREKVVHIGLRAVALCREHHIAAHTDEQGLFAAHFIYGIKLDEYLCKRLKLNTKEKKYNGKSQ